MAHTFVFGRQLNRLDALHYYLGEHDNANVAMCMLAVLDREVSPDTMRDGFATAADEIPRFKDRLRPVPGGLAPPVWTPDPDFDIRHQFRSEELEADAGWPEVLALIDDLQSAPFAPERSPWSVLYVTRAPDCTSVVVLTLHHALSDGTALTLMLSKVFMREALGDAVTDIEVIGSATPAGVLREAVRHHRQSLKASLRSAVHSVSGALRKPSERRFHADEVREYVAGPSRWPVARHSRARRSAYFRVPHALWRETARTRGGGVNDLYLAVAAATLRRYLDATGTRSGHLAVVMPIDVRGKDTEQDGGNVTGAGVLDLTGSNAELMDLREVSRQSRMAQDGAEPPASLFDGALALCPGRVQSKAVFRRFSTKDVLATNVIIPLRCGLHDAQADMVYIVPPVIGTPVSFALAGYGDAVHLAVNMDLGLIADPDMLEGILSELLAEVFGPSSVTILARQGSSGDRHRTR